MKLVTSDNVLVKERKEGLVLISRISPLVSSLQVKEQQQYLEADNLLAQVRQGRSQWKERMSKILDPQKEAVDSAKRAMQAAKDLYNDIDSPLELLESQIKDQMRSFKLEESRLIQEAETAKEKERARIEAEAVAKEAALAKAKTSAMTNKLLEAKAQIQQAMADSKAQPKQEPVKAASSVARGTTCYKVHDVGLLAEYIFCGSLADMTQEQCDLMGLITVDERQLSAYFKLAMKSDKPPELGINKWLPGVEVYKDVIIAGRLGRL